MLEQKAKFEEWAIVSLFGHKRLAGRVTEQEVGGCSFVRIDVPATAKQPAFTELFGQKAIYSISPVTEDVAVMIADRENHAPITPWDVPDEVKQAIREHHKIHQPALPIVIDPPTSLDDDEDEDDDRPF